MKFVYVVTKELQTTSRVVAIFSSENIAESFATFCGGTVEEFVIDCPMTVMMSTLPEIRK